MVKTLLLSAAAWAFLSTGANAQVTGNLGSSVALAVTVPFAPGEGSCNLSTARCLSTTIGVPLDYFASSAALVASAAQSGAAIGAVDQRLATSTAQTLAALGAVDRRLDNALEASAIAAAMQDAIPNDGDRMAFRLNAAAIDGRVGGSLGVSVNVTDSLRISGNYGRGKTQDVFNGGINFSIR